jgi:hypothetical protein
MPPVRPARLRLRPVTPVRRGYPGVTPAAPVKVSRIARCESGIQADARTRTGDPFITSEVGRWRMRAWVDREMKLGVQKCAKGGAGDPGRAITTDAGSYPSGTPVFVVCGSGV